jgi:general secretion pathway protein I
VKGHRGFTLLEMIVATTIMAIAVVGLLAGISGATHNAARLRDYDRIVQLARLRMNELLLDPRLARDAVISGPFDPSLTGGLEAGWQARLSAFESPPAVAPGQFALDRLELQVWWTSGSQRRTFTLDAYRTHTLKPEDIPPVVPQ